jgi:hypothetical protein
MCQDTHQLRVISAHSLRLTGGDSGGSAAATQPLLPYEVAAATETRLDSNRIVMKDMGLMYCRARGRPGVFAVHARRLTVLLL